MYVLLKHNTMIIKLKTDVFTFYSLTINIRVYKCKITKLQCNNFNEHGTLQVYPDKCFFE